MKKVSTVWVVVGGLVVALLLAGIVSFYASGDPDGLTKVSEDKGFADTETGYKFFRRRTVLPLLDEVRDEGWFWDTEFMARAARRGLRVAEVPGAYVRRTDKTSTVRGLRDSARYFRQLLRFRRELLRERA